MSRLTHDKLAARVVMLIAVFQLGLQLSLLMRGTAYLTSSLTIDDTYYYLQTAWNTKQLGFVTFDGLHATNGVQFLWFVIISLLAGLAPSKTALLYATMALTFLLNGLGFVMIHKIGTVLKQAPLTLFLAGFWALQVLPFRVYTMGMENSLHALVFLGVIWQSLLFFVRVQNGDRPNFWTLTVFLILNAWTRLDSALLSALLYALCLLRLAALHGGKFRTILAEYYWSIAGTSLLAGGALAAQLAAFHLMGGTVLPVSALVKTSGAARGLTADAWHKLIEVMVLGMPPIVQGRLPSLGLVVLGLCGIALAFGALARLRGRSPELRVLNDFWLCLLGGDLLYHGYIAVSGVQYTTYFVWYRSPSLIFWTLTASVIAFASFDYLQAVVRRPRATAWVPAGAALAAFSLAIYLFARSVEFESKLYAVRYDSALWIAANSDPETIFAAWNAGQLGYFSDRTFINLDGVINGVDYVERVLHGSTPLADYLYENSVEYVVDYAVYDNLPAYPVVRRFPLEDGSGRSIDMWQVTTQLSSLP